MKMNEKRLHLIEEQSRIHGGLSEAELVAVVAHRTTTIQSLGVATCFRLVSFTLLPYYGVII